MTQPAFKHIYLCILIPILLILPACQTPQTSDFAKEVVPEHFSLEIYRRSTDGRQTYLTVSSKGVLAYGGGRAAISRLTAPVLTLTPAQRRQIWEMVIDNHLLDLPTQSFATPEKMVFIIKITTSKTSSGKTIRLIDHAIPPALIKLNDLLYDWQAKVTYSLQ